MPAIVIPAPNANVKKSDIVNDLTSTATDKPLSANMGKTLEEHIRQLTAKAYTEGASFAAAVAEAGFNAPYLISALESINTGISSVTANVIQNNTVSTDGPAFYAVYAKAGDSYYAGIIFSYYYNPSVYGFYRKNNTFGIRSL